MKFYVCIVFILCCSTSAVFSQDSTALPPVVNIFNSTKLNDTVPARLTQRDSVVRNLHDPRKSTFRSAIIPGWGQAYNKEYWKIPIVYGALSIPTATFIYNNTWYKRTKNAYNIVVNNDTSHYSDIHPKLQGLSSYSLQYYRNTFRRDRDYSVLWFAVIWGLNVVDATVFGHLRDFDVSDDLSLHIQPNYNPVTKGASVAFIFNMKNNKNSKVSD